jgi:2-octaprenyl-6-methoxyphenol hydroxylase
MMNDDRMKDESISYCSSFICSSIIQGNMSNLHSYDVAIVGGGMVGMTLAVALARENMRVVVIEKMSMPSQLESTFDGRVSAIAAGSKNLLNNIGVWQYMQAHAEPILDIRVSDGDTPFFLHYCHREVGSEPFGYIVENRYIRHALHQAAIKLPNIVVMENTSVMGFECDGAGVQIFLPPLRGEDRRGGNTFSTENVMPPTPTLPLKGGGSTRARLLIGADGKKSHIRKLANISAVEWPCKQTAIVCTIKHEKPHDGLAQERFLPAGPFAVLPMRSSPRRGEGTRSSLVWVEPDDRVKLYLDLPEEEFVQEIRERVGEYLGAISVEGKRFSYPLSVLHAKTYVSERLALIGDAAHAIHPIAGQGVNLGFRDVAVLAELLSERFKLGLDIGDAATLEHYQHWRRFDNITMLFVTDWLNRLFSNNLIPIRMARNLGMWAVDKMPPVKRFFMRHAMGLEGDAPKLMAG